jgi:nucleotide-binding universal stress UspA family protein
MFSRILIATDLSEASNQLIKCAGGLRRLGAQEVVLTCSLDVPRARELGETVARLLRPQLQQQRAALDAQGFTTMTELAIGPASVEVNKVAAEHDCSLIVVDAGEHTLADDVLFGSLAGGVLRKAHRAVLVVRVLPCDEDCAACCNALPCVPLEHVLFPTDFSDNAAQALSYVQQLLQYGVKRVTLLHVQDQTKLDRHLRDRLDEFNATDRTRLERFKEQLEAQHAVDVQIELPHGSPTEEILKQARQPGVSLIVMGTHGRGFISEIFLGSVSHNVARHAPVSVLLIPPAYKGTDAGQAGKA